ncbi:hypothetical protein M3Y94_00712200 [Aphelenchoides besseyi]|nr:hypothetical protein M3Y94_00712200 [Aphelenchoides besseyi]KAI6231721.1 hypothetical protein M3Y95_00411700 [Aphelenchoides besseyi]
MSSRSKKKDLNEGFLEYLGIQPSAPMYLKRMEPGNKAELGVSNVVTNLFRTEITPTIVHRYRVDISGLKSNGNVEKNISFTDPTVGDYNVSERRSACLRIFRAMIRKFGVTFNARETLYYDLTSTLYSLNKLKLKDKYTETFEIDEEMLDGCTDLFVKHTLLHCTKFLFKIDAVEGELDTGIVRQCVTANFDQRTVDISHFLDIASSQDMIERAEEFVTFSRGVTYVFEPKAFGYTQDFPFFPNDIYVGLGASKGTRLIEGQNGQAELAIAVEPRLTPFHYWENSVYNKVAHILHTRQAMIQLLRGLYVRPKHLHERLENSRVMSFRIHDIGAPANQQTFIYKNTKMTVEMYFQRYHKIPLQHPEAPVLIAKRGSQRSYYPMELCVVCDNQRVRNLPADVHRQLIRYAAVRPAQLQPQVQAIVGSANLANSEFLRNVGIKVQEQPIKLKARVIAPPEMVYQDKRSAFVQQNGRWEPSAFILPAQSPRIWAMCAFHAQKLSLNDERLEQMCSSYMNACSDRGLQLVDPADCCVIESDGRNRIDVFVDYLLEAVDNGLEFLIVLTPKEDKQIHSFLKAFEQRHGIITQNVLLKTMIDASGLDNNGRGKRLTMENIVNKTNIKLGGLNYEVSSNSNLLGVNHLIIGFALNHAVFGSNTSKTASPSVLGYSANDTKNTGTFAGDYIYQPAGVDSHLSSMHYATQDVFKRYLSNRNNQPPNLVVIYRNGCSDGQFSKVISQEVPMFQSIIDEHFGSNTKLVLMVVNKVHNMRFTPEYPDPSQSTPQQNLRSGVVVDRVVVSPLVSEFYLNSHVTLQGTAKVPRYTVLANNSEMKMDDLQRLTHDLCFTHQIITCPISKPTPSYVAEEYAKRGRNNLNAPYNTLQVRQITRDYADEEERNIEMTNKLAYENHPHREKRINA